MTSAPRIRDLYQEYLQGRITFEDLVEAANRFLAHYEARRSAEQATSADAPNGARNVATAVNNKPRMRDLYQEYVQGRVTFEHLVETANYRLARWKAEQAALEVQSAESRPREPGS